MDAVLRERLLGRRVGVHLALGRGLARAAARAAEIGATTVQVFSDNPSAWRRRPIPPADLPAFLARLDTESIGPIVVHGPYLLNLAGPDDAIRERSIETLVHELRVAPAYGAAFVNVHVGSHRGSGAGTGIRRLGEAVTRALTTEPATIESPLLVLENSAGGGDGLGGTVEELLAILESVASVSAADVSRVRFSIDTAHAWGAGYDLSRPDGTDALLRRFDELIGLGRLALIHLNDSKAPLGSHADRHEHLGAGQIGAAGMGHVLRHDLLRAVPFVLETPGMDAGCDALNMERARLLLAGSALPPLPPGANAARGARTRTPAPDDLVGPQAGPGTRDIGNSPGHASVPTGHTLGATQPASCAHERSGWAGLQRLAASPAQGQEDVPAPTCPASRGRPLDDLPTDPGRPNAVTRDGDEARPRVAGDPRRG
jgi:deoxyribonuclease-4